jgi:hypothetical protein
MLIIFDSILIISMLPYKFAVDVCLDIAAGLSNAKATKAATDQRQLSRGVNKTGTCAAAGSALVPNSHDRAEETVPCNFI